MYTLVLDINTFISSTKEYSEGSFIDWSWSMLLHCCTMLVGDDDDDDDVVVTIDDEDDDDRLLFWIVAAASFEALFSRCHLFLIALSDRPSMHACIWNSLSDVMLSIGNKK